MRFALHLGEDRFGNVVVAAPVCGAFGKSELVDVMAAQLIGERLRCIVYFAWPIDEVAFPSVEGDGIKLRLRCRAWNDGDKTQSEHPGEIGFRNGCGSAGRLDNSGAFANPSVAQTIQK